MRKLLNPELALGFLIATVLWIGVLGWQASYAPTDSEKRQCEQTATKSGRKAEDCKTLWERTTSDPVAFFTFWLVVFTGGLGVSTLMLWRAGEKQIELTRQTSAAQSRDMQESIATSQRSANAAMLAIGSDRAWFTVEQINIGEATNGRIGAREFERAVFARITWKNTGRSPSINTSVYTTRHVIPFAGVTMPVFVPDWAAVGYAGGALPVGPGSSTPSPSYPLVDLERDAFFNREIALVVYSAVKYFDVFNPGVERVSEVCCKITFDGSVIDQTTGQTGHNWMVRAFGPQNTAT